MALSTTSAIAISAATRLLVGSDASGNLFAGQVPVNSSGIELGTVGTPIATSPTLPPGAATDATLASINAKLAALLAAEQPYQGLVAMVVGTAQPTQRAVRIICTAAGNVSLTYADGSVDVIPVSVGLSYIAGACTTVNSSGTTATATYANMK